MNKFIKRFIDICVSSIGLLLLSPIFLALVIAIKSDSEGPAFFQQERRSKNGKIFTMYKFRSMRVDSEKSGSGLFNYENDPRVTKVGRFLRNSSLDELPQLINVLKGDISLVGPRPCVVYELGDFDTLNKTYKKRFEVKGGITGLAQVKGRNENSWHEKVLLDNQYIDEFEKYGILLDIKILMLTVISVFKHKDIYEEKINSNVDAEESARLEEEEIIRMAHLPEDEIDKILVQTKRG